MGFEPTASGTTIRRSNQLSYSRQNKKHLYSNALFNVNRNDGNLSVYTFFYLLNLFYINGIILRPEA